MLNNLITEAQKALIFYTDLKNKKEAYKKFKPTIDLNITILANYLLQEGAIK